MSVSVEVASEVERSASGKIPFVVRRAGVEKPVRQDGARRRR
jgi:hypothetical protein